MAQPMTLTIRVLLRSYSTYRLSRITYLIAQLVSLADHLTIRLPRSPDLQASLLYINLVVASGQPQT